MSAEWKNTTVEAGAKLFKVHNFTYMTKGVTYLIEIDEFLDGKFTGHGEHSTDKSSVLVSVTKESMSDCLNELIKNIISKHS